MGRFPMLLATAAVLVFAAGPATAGDTEVGTLYRSLSIDEVQSLLDSMMLANTRAHGSDGAPAWQLQLAGVETILFLEDCDDTRCGSVQLWAGFSTPEPVNLALLNDWNRDHRFTRAYRGIDGNTNLESDLDLGGGVSLRAIVEQLRTFRASAVAFSDALTADAAPQ